MCLYSTYVIPARFLVPGEVRHELEREVWSDVEGRSVCQFPPKAVGTFTKAVHQIIISQFSGNCPQSVEGACNQTTNYLTTHELHNHHAY